MACVETQSFGMVEKQLELTKGWAISGVGVE